MNANLVQNQKTKNFNLEVWFFTRFDDRDYKIISVQATSENLAVEKAKKQICHPWRIFDLGVEPKKKLY